MEIKLKSIHCLSNWLVNKFNFGHIIRSHISITCFILYLLENVHVSISRVRVNCISMTFNTILLHPEGVFIKILT